MGVSQVGSTLSVSSEGIGGEGTGLLEKEAVDLTRDLIRFDTRNDGEGSCRELPSARWAARLLGDVGIDSTIIESEPGRANLIADVKGEDPSLPTLLVHGHLDTVPADSSQWTADPVAGEIRSDGSVDCLWGRGAVDMKNMVGMSLAAIRDIRRSGERPRRNLRFILFADEEAGGFKGSEWLAANRPEAFEGVRYVISETGGFSGTVAGRRVYFVQVGEKGTQWFSLSAQGRQSHGSQINPDNAVVRVARAAVRIADYRWPVDLNPVTRLLFGRIASLLGENDSPLDEGRVSHLIETTGFARPWVESSVRNTFNVTSIDAGSTVNIVPSAATGLVDGRALPGQEDLVHNTLRRLAGDEGLDVRPIHRSRGYLSDPDGELFAGIEKVLHEVDPDAVVLPFLASGGTDGKAILRLDPSIQICGFIPLQVPDGFDYIGKFHGIDERVPLSSLSFGARTLRRFITTF